MHNSVNFFINIHRKEPRINGNKIYVVATKHPSLDIIFKLQLAVNSFK